MFRGLWGRYGALVIAALILGALYLMPSGLPDEVRGPAFVIDGDSIEIIGDTIRLHGIDAPEGEQYCERNGRNWACGHEAAEALRRKIGGRTVDCDPVEFDQYERILATCSVGGENLNAWLVKNGWAVSFGRYRAEELAARQAKNGVWAGSFERPSEWRRERGI